MDISNSNAKTFLLDTHQDIEEYADALVNNILDKKDFNLPGRQGEFHPKPPTEPYVKVSLHTARLILTGLNLK